MGSCHFTKPQNILFKLTPDGASYSSLRGWNNLKARQELVVLLCRKCRQDRLSKQESTRQKKDAGDRREGENARLEEETQLALLTMLLLLQLLFELDVMTKLGDCTNVPVFAS